METTGRVVSILLLNNFKPMIVYKFGGASVKSAEGVRNLAGIVSAAARGGLMIIVSAMGKTTNALERVTAEFMEGHRQDALTALEETEQYHVSICEELFGGSGDAGSLPIAARAHFDRLRIMLSEESPDGFSYDFWYDRIVSCGELVSTTIVSHYLNCTGVDSRWMDIRSYFKTTDRHRDANIDMDVSGPLLRQAVDDIFAKGSGCPVIVAQGFIGSTSSGETTTLGREGSDYSAAVAANLLDATGLTIWKDVDGILNADPKYFCGTRLIPELNYLDAIELAYSGAQVIHPKTIKPLKAKNIPLYVRPFLNVDGTGSIISGEAEGTRLGTPVFILKKNQVLISVRPHDFSFVLEDRLPEIFELMRVHNIRMNLIQSSAVNLSLCVDEGRQLEPFGEALRERDFRVVYNEGLELLTIRGYDEDSFRRHTAGQGIYLVQKTRHNVRIVRKQTLSDTCMEL